MTIFKLLQRMKMVWHPVASPLFIGLGLPQLYYEKRYIEIPVMWMENKLDDPKCEAIVGYNPITKLYPIVFLGVF